LTFVSGKAIVPLAPGSVSAIGNISEEGTLGLTEAVVDVPHTVTACVVEVLAVGLSHVGGAHLAALTWAHHLKDDSTGQVATSGILYVQSHTGRSSPSSTISAASLGGEGGPDELVAGLGVGVLATTRVVVVLDSGTDGFVGWAESEGVAGEDDELNSN
jgi:hypothetical protein